MKSGKLVLGLLSALTAGVVVTSVVYTKSYVSEDQESSKKDKDFTWWDTNTKS